MIIALSIWENGVAPVFDVSQQVLLMDISATGLTGEQPLRLIGENPFRRAKQLVDAGVDVLVCGAISRPMQRLLISQGLQVHPFVTGPLEEIKSFLVAGQWPGQEYQMPGCCGQRGRCGGGHGPQRRRGRNGWRTD